MSSTLNPEKDEKANQAKKPVVKQKVLDYA